MTPDEWAKCIIVLRAAYGTSFKLDTAGIAVWFEMLGDLPGDRIQAAVAYMVKTQRAFPSIADIRALSEPPAPDSGAAWAIACRHVSTVSRGRIYRGGEIIEPLTMDDPAIAAGIEAVGMEAIRMRQHEGEGTLRAHFAKAYEARLNAERRRSAGLLEPSRDLPAILSIATMSIGNGAVNGSVKP